MFCNLVRYWTFITNAYCSVARIEGTDRIEVRNLHVLRLYSSIEFIGTAEIAAYIQTHFNPETTFEEILYYLSTDITPYKLNQANIEVFKTDKIVGKPNVAA